MKKFNEILAEIKATNEHIAELDKEQKRLEAEYKKPQNVSYADYKKRVEENKTYYEELDKKVTQLYIEEEDAKIKIKFMENNARLSFFYETMPKVLEVLAKYKNKPYGEKTREKIRKEIIENANCYFYIGSSYGGQSYHISPTEYYGTNYDIECGTEYTNGTKKSLLIDNKIQIVTMEELKPYYINTTYYEDVEEAVKEIKRLHREARQKQEELERICSQFRDFSVKGIREINYYNHIYNSIL